MHRLLTDEERWDFSNVPLTHSRVESQLCEQIWPLRRDQEKAGEASPKSTRFWIHKSYRKRRICNSVHGPKTHNREAIRNENCKEGLSYAKWKSICSGSTRKEYSESAVKPILNVASVCIWDYKLLLPCDWPMHRWWALLLSVEESKLQAIKRQDSLCRSHTGNGIPTQEQYPLSRFKTRKHSCRWERPSEIDWLRSLSA